MTAMKVLLVCAIWLITASGARSDYWPDWENDEFHYGTFPQDFIWASATSAYQVEGGWDADGKTMSIWDTFVREPNRIADNSTGDVACDSYNRYTEDIKILKQLGVRQYRLSIAWARIFPNKEDETPNPKGLEYYHNLIDGLLADGIEPLVTLYHWDLPQWIEDQGGWTNRSLIVNTFSTFSRVCFQEFGPKVKYWITINEPWVVAWLTYGVGAKAPGYRSPAEDPYIVAHIQILAHAEAWHIYNNEFRASQGGVIGITLNGGYGWPKDPNNTLDVAAAERSILHDIGWFADPIFLDGHYPREMAERVRNKSLAQGYTESRMPEMTEEEAARVKGTSDFFGINTYTGTIVEHVDQPLSPPSYDLDKDLRASRHPSWPESGSGWLHIVPASIRGLLNWVKNRYNNKPVFITENGVSDRNQSIHDTHRVNYLRGYINNVLKAIDLDGCNVMGYTAWSLMDNFEWESGYLEYFGIHYVNFSSPERTRIPKDSAVYFTQVVSDNGFPMPATTDTTPNSGRPLLPSVSLAVFLSILICLV